MNMRASFERPSFWLFACVLLALLVPLSHCVTDSGAPVVVDGGVNVVEGGTIYEDGGATIYKISGTASGIPQGMQAGLTINGQSPLMVGNGTFTFPGLFAAGQSYQVALSSSPKGYACALSHAMGTVGTGDVTNVALACSSMDATLTALTVSAASLSPAFDPTKLAYTASARIPGIIPPYQTTTVTATTKDAGATIKIAGAAATSGSPSAPITLKSGVNAIDVAVTAADGVTTTHYAIAFTGIVNDYLKASNTRTGAAFGTSVAISADGSTLAVGAPFENSNAQGIDGNMSDTSSQNAGAVYVFRRTGATWAQEAYVKASNTLATCVTMMGCNGAAFGSALALSSDGNTMAVAAHGESSSSVGINGVETGTAEPNAGAVFVFTRAGTTWSQQAYVKASNTNVNFYFGSDVALSSDGNTMAVGSMQEASATKGVDGPQNDISSMYQGAVYVFTRSGTTWTQQSYLKPSNTRAACNSTDCAIMFGTSVALSSDGNTLAVGGNNENSNATGVGGDETNTSALYAGAVYVFTRSGSTWSQQAYVKASNTAAQAFFGSSVALSSDGNTLATSAPGDSSVAMLAGSVYVFTRTGIAWSQQAYVKPSTARANLELGSDLALTADGNVLVIGAVGDQSSATGIDPPQTAPGSGLVPGGAYVYARSGTTWTQMHWVKPSNAGGNFGCSVASSSDAKTIAIGAVYDASNATGVNGDQKNTSVFNAGAVYVF
jgi:hypothetical protein